MDVEFFGVFFEVGIEGCVVKVKVERLYCFVVLVIGVVGMFGGRMEVY